MQFYCIKQGINSKQRTQMLSYNICSNKKSQEGYEPKLLNANNFLLYVPFLTRTDGLQ